MAMPLRILSLIALCLGPSLAFAEPYRSQYAPQPPGRAESVGCYWFDGIQYCARYCYFDVDGVRYCREDAGLAVPQGPIAAPPPPPACEGPCRPYK